MDQDDLYSTINHRHFENFYQNMVRQARQGLAVPHSEVVLQLQCCPYRRRCPCTHTHFLLHQWSAVTHHEIRLLLLHTFLESPALPAVLSITRKLLFYFTLQLTSNVR